MGKTGGTTRSEADEQKVVVQYCDFKGIPVYHIPNQRNCSPRTGAHLKAQGLRPGVPDLCIPMPSGKYHALYIEMKAQKGKPTAEQVEWLNLLRSYGNAAYICYGADNAISLIDEYVTLTAE